VENKLRKYLYAAWVVSMVFTAQTLDAQHKPTPKHVDLANKPDAENLNVFQQWIRWNNPGSLLIDHLTKQANNYYDIRDNEISKLKTKDHWEGRRKIVREKLMELVGPFPSKTPLNPKITGILKKKGYRVEKIVYESMPGFYVTACLFIPDGIKGKAPAVLNVIGHEQESFRAELDGKKGNGRVVH